MEAENLYFIIAIEAVEQLIRKRELFSSNCGVTDDDGDDEYDGVKGGNEEEEKLNVPNDQII